ncbi:MAG: hypothetical protein V1679_00985 [Candidatus Peregrinibacteria bacterium]
MEKVKDDVAVGGSERTRNNVLDDVHEILYEYFGASTQEVMHKSLADLAYNLAMLVPIEMTAADIKARVTKILESVGVLAGLPKGAKWNCFQHPRDELSERSRAARKRKIMALVGGGLLAAGLTAGGIALLASGSGSAASTTTTLDNLKAGKAAEGRANPVSTDSRQLWRKTEGKSEGKTEGKSEGKSEVDQDLDNIEEDR